MVTPITPGINWTPTVACSSSLSSVAQEPPKCLWGGQRVSCHDVTCAHVLAAVYLQLQENTWKSYISCWGQISYHPARSKVQGRIAKFDGISTTAIEKKTFFQQCFFDVGVNSQLANAARSFLLPKQTQSQSLFLLAVWWYPCPADQLAHFGSNSVRGYPCV